MSESVESMEARINRKVKCQIPGCKNWAAWQPFVQIPPIEGIDRKPPKAEIEFVLCDGHMSTIDPMQFLGEPVRLAIEGNLIRWTGRPIDRPVDWSKAVVGFDKLISITVVEA